MKKIRTLFLALAATAMVFVGCDKDDDDNSNNNSGNGQQSATDDLTFQKNGNTLTATWTTDDEGVTVRAEFIAVFGNDGLCTSATMKGTYPTEADAQRAYREAQQEEEFAGQISIQGKTISVDFTEEFEGRTEQQVRQYITLFASDADDDDDDGMDTDDELDGTAWLLVNENDPTYHTSVTYSVSFNSQVVSFVRIIGQESTTMSGSYTYNATDKTGVAMLKYTSGNDQNKYRFTFSIADDKLTWHIQNRDVVLSKVDVD